MALSAASWSEVKAGMMSVREGRDAIRTLLACLGTLNAAAPAPQIRWPDADLQTARTGVGRQHLLLEPRIRFTSPRMRGEVDLSTPTACESRVRGILHVLRT